MNTRTNLRNWRNESTYVIMVSMVGANTKHPYIAARLEAITATPYSTKQVALGMMNFTIGSDRIYTIQHNRADGISTPQHAINEAIRLYKDEMQIDKTV